MMFKGSSFVNKALSGMSSLLASDLVYVGGTNSFLASDIVTKTLEASHFSLVTKALEASHFSSFRSCALVKKALTMGSLPAVSLVKGRLPAFIGCHPGGLLAFMGCHACPFSQEDVVECPLPDLIHHLVRTLLIFIIVQSLPLGNAGAFPIVEMCLHALLH